MKLESPGSFSGSLAQHKKNPRKVESKIENENNNCSNGVCDLSWKPASSQAESQNTVDYPDQSQNLI